MMKSKRKQERPVGVTTKNAIGETVGKILGYAVRGAKRVVKTYREAQAAYRGVRDERLNDLIRRSYSSDTVEQVKARVQLQKEYPQIYRELGFYQYRTWKGE